MLVNVSMMKKISILFLCLFINVVINAQDIAQISLVGEPQIAEGELIDNNRRDVNGRLAAGLIVETDLTNLSFESRNGIIGTTTQPGRYFVFLSPDERIVYIRSNGFKQLTLYLNDVGIRLKSGQVWKIDVTGQRPANMLPVNIQVDQSGAKVLIDGDLIDYNKSNPIAVGSHTIRIEKEEYKTIVETIEVTDSKTLFSYKMEKVLAQAFTIRSEPRGATVLIDDQVAETPTPYQTFKYPGLYQVTVTLPGYRVVTKTVEVTEDEPVNENFTLQKTVATVSMDVQPLGATVKINGRDYTGQNRIELAAGTYFLEVSKQGYKTQSSTVTLKEYEQKDVRFNLEQLVGSLQILSNEPDARITIQSQTYTKTIKGIGNLRDIPAGVYEIRAKLDGYVDIIETVYVKENDVTQKQINFTDEQKQAFIQEQQKLEAQRQEEQRRIAAAAERKRKANAAAAARKRRNMYKVPITGGWGFSFAPSMTFQDNYTDAGSSLGGLTYTGYNVALQIGGTGLFGGNDFFFMDIGVFQSESVELTESSGLFGAGPPLTDFELLTYGLMWNYGQGFAINGFYFGAGINLGYWGSEYTAGSDFDDDSSFEVGAGLVGTAMIPVSDTFMLGVDYSYIYGSDDTYTQRLNFKVLFLF